MKTLIQFWRAERGVISVLFVVLLPVLLFAGAVAIDLTKLNAQKRHVQSQAELAALSAARQPRDRTAKFEAALKTSSETANYGLIGFDEQSVKLGVVSSMGFSPLADQENVAAANAVRVDVTTKADLLVLRLFMSDDDLTIARSAVATYSPPRVSFALSNCLLNLRLLDPILRPILGVKTDVLCSGRGIDTQIDVLPFLDVLSVRANALTPSGDPLTYGELLGVAVPASDVFSALTGEDVFGNHGNITLGDVIYLSPDLASLRVGSPVRDLRVDISDLAFASAEVLATRILDLQLGLNLGPLANVGAAIRVSDPRKIVIGAIPGDPNAVATTSQIEIDLAEINILGIIDLKLNVKVANATARLSTGGDACAPSPSAVVAVFDPVDVSLLDVAIGVRVLGLPQGQALLAIDTDTVRDRQTRRVAFTRSEYENAPIRVLAPTGQNPDDTAVSSLVDGLAGLLNGRQQAIDDARPTCGGLLGCLLGGTLQVLNTTLSTVVGTLTQTVVNIVNSVGAEGTLTNAILEDLVGLGIARAELELLDVTCGGGPRLSMSGTDRTMAVLAPMN
jgi:uncharacterized membrane protein